MLTLVADRAVAEPASVVLRDYGVADAVALRGAVDLWIALACDPSAGSFAWDEALRSRAVSEIEDFVVEEDGRAAIAYAACDFDAWLFHANRVVDRSLARLRFPGIDVASVVAGFCMAVACDRADAIADFIRWFDAHGEVFRDPAFAVAVVLIPFACGDDAAARAMVDHLPASESCVDDDDGVDAAMLVGLARSCVDRDASRLPGLFERYDAVARRRLQTLLLDRASVSGDGIPIVSQLCDVPMLAFAVLASRRGVSFRPSPFCDPSFLSRPSD